MDNITHTLAGLALADAGLKHRTRLGTLTLLLAANLPDVDGFVYAFGTRIDGLSFRRGWTHGVLAMIVLPLLLVALILAVRRIVRGAKAREGVQARWLLALAAIGVWSHPLLDLLNTYGVRLLMPFSSHWFYGDALFIVDPWVWAALLSGIILSRRRGRRRTLTAEHAFRPARVALGLCAAYALSMAISGRIGRLVVERQAQGTAARHVLVAPVFGNPFRREVVRELDDRYELGELAIGRRWSYAAFRTLPSGVEQPGAGEAARTPDGAGFLRWSRFPHFAARKSGGGSEVTINDLRYGGPGNRGWASVTIPVAGGTPQTP